MTRLCNIFSSFCKRWVSVSVSLLTYPAVQTHSDVPREQREKLGITDTLLRLSVGIENPDDIIADLKQAFENAEK